MLNGNSEADIKKSLTAAAARTCWWGGGGTHDCRPNRWSTLRRASWRSLRTGWDCWTPRWLQLECWLRLRLERSAWGTTPYASSTSAWVSNFTAAACVLCMHLKNRHQQEQVGSCDNNGRTGHGWHPFRWLMKRLLREITWNNQRWFRAPGFCSEG